MTCQQCDGPLSSLGCLGSTWWFRCRACGLEQRNFELAHAMQADADDAPLEELDAASDILERPR